MILTRGRVAIGNLLILVMLAFVGCDDSNGGSSGAAAPTALTGCGTRACSKVVASDEQSDDAFGWRTAIDGTVMVVGMVGTDAVSPFVPGAAYVYRFDGVAWQEEQKLVASDGKPGDNFGISVAIESDLIVVGAFGVDNGSDVGAAYVFRYNGATWDEEAKLVGVDSMPEDHFGQSVSIDTQNAFGDVVVVGAPFAASIGFFGSTPRVGAVYTFRDPSGTGTWVEGPKLQPAGVVEGFFLGFNVKVDGNVMVASAHLGEFGGVAQRGWVYFFRYNGTAWVHETQRVRPNVTLPAVVAPGSMFGLGLAVDGNFVVVGAPFDDGAGVDAGAVFVYRYISGTTWAAPVELLATGLTSEDRFGRSVAIDGDRIVVGSPNSDAGNGTGSGSIYVYERTGVAWNEAERITPSDGKADAQFGTSVSISGLRIGIGAVGDDPAGPDSGSTYVIDY